MTDQTFREGTLRFQDSLSNRRVRDMRFASQLRVAPMTIQDFVSVYDGLEPLNTARSRRVITNRTRNSTSPQQDNLSKSERRDILSRSESIPKKAKDVDLPTPRVINLSPLKRDNKSPAASSATKSRPDVAPVKSFSIISSILLSSHIQSLASSLAREGLIQESEKDLLMGQIQKSKTLTNFMWAYARFISNDDLEQFLTEIRNLLYDSNQ